MRSMEAVRGSCKRLAETWSAKRNSTALQARDNGRETRSPSTRGRREGFLLVAACSATSLEMAVWYPAAVREKDRESTGLKS